MIEITALSDSDLTERLKMFVVDERRCLAEVLEHLAEFDHRKLYGGHGHASSFIYCTKALGYAEEAAYRRIYVAKLARQFPGIFNRIRTGRITLNAVVLLGPHLTGENHRSLLDWACGRPRRDIERKVASLAPSASAASIDVIGEVLYRISYCAARSASADPTCQLNSADSLSSPPIVRLLIAVGALSGVVPAPVVNV